MASNSIQFQKDLSLPGFQQLYGSEKQGAAALEKGRWPDMLRCRNAMAMSMGSSTADGSRVISAYYAANRPGSQPAPTGWSVDAT